MRTTLNIDDDLLFTVKELARVQSTSAGEVVSNLLRQSLARDDSDGAGDCEQDSRAEFGFRPFPNRGGVVTNELLNRLREEIGD